MNHGCGKQEDTPILCRWLNVFRDSISWFLSHRPRQTRSNPLFSCVLILILPPAQQFSLFHIEGPRLKNEVQAKTTSETNFQPARKMTPFPPPHLPPVANHALPPAFRQQTLVHKVVPLLVRELAVASNTSPGALAQGAARAAVSLCLPPLLEVSCCCCCCCWCCSFRCLVLLLMFWAAAAAAAAILGAIGCCCC